VIGTTSKNTRTIKVFLTIWNWWDARLHKTVIGGFDISVTTTFAMGRARPIEAVVAWTYPHYPHYPQEQARRRRFIPPFNWRIFDDFEIK
jgi:hypothetical protein